MGTVAAFIAGCGGAGKTTAAINFASRLAVDGQRVLLVDAAAGLPDLDASLGVETRVRRHLGDVASGTCRLVEALLPIGRGGGLWLLPAGTGGPVDALASICRDAAVYYDHILIDAPAGNEQGSLFAAAAAERHIIVAQHTPHDRRGVETILGRLRAFELDRNRPLFLFNRVTAERAAASGVTRDDLLAAWGAEPEDVLGSVPEDEQALIAKQHGEPIGDRDGHSPAAEAYTAAVARYRELLTSAES